MMTKDLEKSLQAALPDRTLLTDPQELVVYEVDGGLTRGHPDGVVYMEKPEDVTRLVAWANAHAVPLIGRGAGTGLSGGTVPHLGGVIVEFSRMNHIVQMDPAGRSVSFEPGVVNQTLDEFVKTQGLFYPADPASGRACTLGGNIGENAGGPHCFKYGVTTNYITGLDVVLANGRQVRFGGRALDYPEYDWTGLFTGSEGTLGLVVRAYARLLRNPPAVQTLLAIFDTVEDAGVAVSALIARGLVPATLEMMDQKIIRIVEDYTHAGLPVDAGALLILEADGYAESLPPQVEEMTAILREHQAREIRSAKTAAERENIWYARKSAIGAVARLAAGYLLVDGTVPRSALAQTLAAVNRICDTHGLRVGYVFHAGDGNLHPLILIERPDDPTHLEHVHSAAHEVLAYCVAQGGTITGEHGVGIEKREYMRMMYTAEELQTMREVKDLFDPAERFNPGKIFPESPSTETPRPAPAASAPGAASEPPVSAQQAATQLRAWAVARRGIRIRGAGTRSRGLAKSDEVFSTRGLAGIRTFSLENLYVTAGAGTTASELQGVLGKDRMCVPIVAPWPESTLGGIVATNWNAPLRMRYGGLRDLVLAMTVALPNGRVLRIGRPVVKNVAGYDLIKLFIGSYGTLGLVIDVTFKLAPLPRRRASLVVPVQDLARGLDLGARLLRVCLNASALLLCRGWSENAAWNGGDSASSWNILYTVEGMNEDVTAELAEAHALLLAAGQKDVRTVEDLAGSAVWADFVARTYPEAGLLRLGLPPMDLPAALAQMAPEMDAAPFVADLANGLIYQRAAQETHRLREIARERGGYAMTLGVGEAQSPLEAWGYTPESLDWMRALKRLWDERGVLNPGVLPL